MQTTELNQLMSDDDNNCDLPIFVLQHQ